MTHHQTLGSYYLALISNCQLNVIARLHLSTLVPPPPLKFVIEYHKIKRGNLNITYLFFPAIFNLCFPRKPLRSNINIRTLFVLALQQFRPCPQVWVFTDTYKIFIKKSTNILNKTFVKVGYCSQADCLQFAQICYNIFHLRKYWNKQTILNVNCTFRNLIIHLIPQTGVKNQTQHGESVV